MPKLNIGSPPRIKIQVGDADAVHLRTGAKYVNIGAEEYRGTYDVTPKPYEAQTLKTKDKVMGDDVRVKKIPYYEVSNTDGVTVSIGKEVI